MNGHDAARRLLRIASSLIAERDESFVLHHPDAELLWAWFVPAGEDKMRVTALLGAASYIDRDMSSEEARKVWKRLTGKGWKQVGLSVAKREMPLRRLRMEIYD